MVFSTLILTTLAIEPGFGTVNAVGYVNVPVPPGFSLLSNPLINKADARISGLFRGDYADGCQLFVLRPGGFVVAEYFADSQEWLPAEVAELKLYPGEGFFFLNVGKTVTVTFVGEVPAGTLTNHIPAGFSLRASMVPVQSTLDRWNFPADPGDQVFVLNSLGQGYTSYTFDEFELRWLPSPPPITPGQAFYVFKQKPADWVEVFSIYQ